VDKRQIKIGIGAFLIVLLATMIGIKPFLFRAIYHNFPNIYSYGLFVNREIPAKSPGRPWVVSAQKISDPDTNTVSLLEKTKTTAVLVIENGQIVYEKYSLNGGVDTISGSFSMAKSIVSLLYGFALQEGRIKSLDEPISHYLTEWEGRIEGKITIRNLLQMASGLNWKEQYWNPFNVTTEAYYGNDLYSTTFKQFTIEPPGTHFSYQSGTAQLLGLILTRAVNENLSTYFSKRLWIPLGAEKNALWSLDHENGMEKAFCCITATARDYARIGEFVRLNGKWGDKELLNESYIQQMLTPSNLPDRKGRARNDYGYQWLILDTLQGKVYFAWGIYGQYIVVIPQKNRVLVRLGMNSGKMIDHYPEELTALIHWVAQ
jgi:CubicO group peptidase (beta-lactamase class C family)